MGHMRRDWKRAAKRCTACGGELEAKPTGEEEYTSKPAPPSLNWRKGIYTRRYRCTRCGVLNTRVKTTRFS